MRIFSLALAAAAIAAGPAFAETVIIEQPTRPHGAVIVPNRHFDPAAEHARDAARWHQHQAREAQHVAREDARMGDYAGAARAQAYSNNSRAAAQQDRGAARAESHGY